MQRHGAWYRAQLNILVSDLSTSCEVVDGTTMHTWVKFALVLDHSF